MRKNYFSVILCVLLGAVAQQAVAEDLSAVDFFGTWKFTSTLEVTEAGKEMENEFKGECEVIIKEDGTYDMVIVGVGGGTINQPVNKIDNANCQLNVINPNGTTTLWPSATMADENGKYPYGTTENKWKDSYNNIKYTFDPATKEITIPDFTAVTPNHSDETAVVLAKFTNCKLTLVSADVKEAYDLSGDYKFTAVYYNEKSTFPSSFMVNLSSTSPVFTAYDATLTIEGYNEVVVPATFDGYTLTMEIHDVYLNNDSTIAFSNYNNPDSLHVSWKFVATSDRVLSMDTNLGISRWSDEDSTFVPESYYQWAGNLVKQIERVGREGSYQFTSEVFYLISTEAKDAAFTSDVTLTLKFDETQQKYYVTEFLGFNTVDLNYGGIPCVENENVIEIDITGGYNYLLDEFMSDDYTEMIYLKLYDAAGKKESKIKLTFNEDGTCTLGDFFVMREYVTYDADWNSTIKAEQVAFYGTMKDGALIPDTYAGTYTATPNVKEVYDESLMSKFPESFSLTITQDETTLKYYVTEFMGFDTNSMNYGGIPCVETEEGLEMDITGGYNFLEQIYMSDDWSQMGYYKLFDGEASVANRIKITFDGKNCTLDNFYVQRVDLVYDENYNSTETVTPVAYYGAEASAIEEVVSNEKVQITVEGGVVYLNEAAPVMVYSISGACVYRGVTSEISGLNKGIYVVKIGNAVVKVAL